MTGDRGSVIPYHNDMDALDLFLPPVRAWFRELTTLARLAERSSKDPEKDPPSDAV